MDPRTRDRVLVALGVAERHLPGLHDQSKHGRLGPTALVKKAVKALTGQAALDAVPARLTPGPDAHFGNYAGENLDGPEGVGSVRALSEYEGVEYGTTNGVLRNPDRWADYEGIDEVRGRVAEIDKTMAVSRLDADVEVHRVVKDGQMVFGRDVWFGDIIDWDTEDFDAQDKQIEVWKAGARPDLTGLEWREDAYVSTTVDPAIVEAYAKRFDNATMGASFEGTVILNIRVPKGVGGVQMSGIGNRQEAEILLERGLRMRIVKDHGEDENGRRILDIEVVTDD